MGKQRQPNSISESTLKRLRANLADPDIDDRENPAFLYSLTSNDLLLAIAGGVIDPHELARRELANRGVDQNGNWIHPDKAREIWKAEL